MAIPAPHAADLRRRLTLGRRSGVPVPLLATGLTVAALASLPLVYLVIRALEADAGALALAIRPRTLGVLASTLVLGGAVGVGSVLIGLPIAWLTARTDLPGRRWWTVLSVVPLAIPSYVIAFSYIAALGPRGALADLLEPLGIVVPSFYGLPAAVLVLSLAGYPYVVLGVRAALLRSDPALEEAGRALGDSPRRAFRRITLPLLAPALAAGALLAVLYAIADFGAVGLLQFDSFARAIYTQYRSAFDRSLAAVLGLLLVGVTFLVATVEVALRRRASAWELSAPRRPPTPVTLGRWRWPSLVYIAGVVLAALGLPAATLAFWLVRGLVAGEPLRLLGDATGNSLLAGTAAAAVSIALAMPLTFLLARRAGGLTGWIERILYGTYAVPGIVVALSTVFFVLNVTPIVYQSMLVLVIVYAVRFLPQALGGTRTSLAQVGPRLGEVARSLGERPVGVLRSVTLPLIRPGIVAGAALVFLTTVKELPITLLLGPTGFQTLATVTWGAATEGFYARAAAPAATLMVLSAASIALLLRAEARER